MRMRATLFGFNLLLTALVGSARADSAACLMSGNFNLGSPGLTGVPSTGPITLSFSGPLSGPGCGSHAGKTLGGNGTLFMGSSCSAAVGSGTLSGVPGLSSFVTASVGPFPQVVLQDGAVPAGYMTVEFASNGPGVALDCAPDAGITGGSFNAVVVIGTH